MINAKILFAGLLMFCDQDGMNVCSGKEVSDGSPVRALVLNISATGEGCTNNKCEVCSGKKIKFHKPILIFQEGDLGGGKTCMDVGSANCPQYGSLCCFDITNKRLVIKTDRQDFQVIERPDGYAVPPDPQETKYPFGWVADMTYYYHDLKLRPRADLDPGRRVTAWVDLDDGELSSMLMARGREPTDDFVEWYPFPYRQGQHGSALAEAVYWERHDTSKFEIYVDGSSPAQFVFEGSEVRLLISNLPDIPLQTTSRKPGRFDAEHFAAYYNLFDPAPEDCQRPMRSRNSKYFAGGTDFKNWLLDTDNELKTWVAERREAGLAGENAVCSPSKFP